jgi:hypothetical protein
MRGLWILLLLSCSSSPPLTFKIQSASRSVASNGAEKTEVPRVARIQAKFNSPRIFSSGLDSAQLEVKLFDSQGNPLTQIDPAELYLSASHELEALPFTVKQGIYKTSILPRPKSKLIYIQVEWKNKIKGPILTLDASVFPLREKLRPQNQDYLESRTHGEIMVRRGNRTPSSMSEEFSFINVGINQIVSKTLASRSFHFEYPEQARQNIALHVEDALSEDSSEVLHSYFMFFPRKQLPVIEQTNDELVVTLPTGEKVSFDKTSKTLKSGVLYEGPQVSIPNTTGGQFADLKYRGRGVLLRANAQGASPQLGDSSTEKIDLNHGIKGGQDVLIINGTTGQRCRRPKSDFWGPESDSIIEFNFSSDEAFEVYLENKCGFGLPKF